MIALLTIGVFVVTLLLGVPVFFVLGLTSFTYFVLKDLSPLMIMQRMFVGLDQFVIMAVPLFILAGNIMARGGAMIRLVKFAKVLVGHLQGGLAHVNVVASMLFAGITGAATADVSALGPLEITLMEQGGYKKDFATAVTISSSCIGPIIPPSLPLVVYGVVASVSIGQLFLAGIVPGVIMGLALMGLIYVYAGRQNHAVTPRATFPEFWTAFKRAFGPLGLPVLIIGGIYSGAFTPTEAAALACLYAAIMELFIYKDITWKDLPGIFKDTGIITAASLSIVAIAACFSWILAIEKVPLRFAQLLLSVTDNKILLLILINFGLLLLGCVMETLASIIICAPIFLPIVMSLGVDPVHFGVIMAINLTLGLLTPPLGLNLFIASAITKLSVDHIAKTVLPFFAVLVGVVLLVSLFPDLAMFLPRLLMR